MFMKKEFANEFNIATINLNPLNWI